MSKRTLIGGHDGPSGSASKKRRISETGNSSDSSGSENTQHGNANQLPQTNDEMPPECEKGSNAAHGQRFQSKLLMLFCIRAINAGYDFYLGTELADQGKKFDDLIFKYNKDKNADETRDDWSYKYLQAKSRLNEKDEKIEVNDLFDIPVAGGKKKGLDFNLPKYFRSYLEIKKRGDKIDSCIICTNIDFADQENLKKDGIQLKEVKDQELADPILKFEELSNNKIPKCYKILEITKEDLSKKLKEETTPKLLAKMLLNSINKKIKLNSKSELIRNYHMALIRENVINLATKKFHVDFIKGSNGLSEGAKELRQNLLIFNDIDKNWESLSFNFDENFGKTPLKDEIFNYSLPVAVKEDEEIVGFLNKLIFAVNTPNEGELDDILKREVGKYYKLRNTDIQSAYIMNKMIDWFKSKTNLWLSSGEAKKLFLNKTKNIMESLRVTANSINYQNQLKEALEFNDKAIGKMIKKLEKLFASSNNIGRIATHGPRRTVVKVIAALEKLKKNSKPPATNNKIPSDYFQYKDSYLVMSSSRLKKKHSKIKKILQQSEHSHHLLVVVCEDGPSKETNERTKETPFEFCQKLVNKMQNKRVIIISQDEGEVEDELNFSDLSGNFQLVLLKKEIEFQGLKQSVGDLIKRNDTTLDDLIKNGGEEKILDFNSIEELITAKTIEIPSGNSAKFEQNLYIKRKLEFPLANFNQFYDRLAQKLKCEKEKLQNEFKVDSQGNIEWSVKDDGEKKICGKTEKKVKEKENENSINSSSANDDATPEEEVTNINENRKGRVVKKSRKQEIWEEMKKIVKENSISTRFSNGNLIKRDLITNENRKRKVFILDGIAGTGKSTILSNYYEKIKKENPNTWVIRIDLLDCPNELKKFSPVNQQSAIKFFVDIFAKNSPFARSLLTHRFETDGRIVVMLDGFNEIGDELREKVFQLITAIKLTNIDALYLTTRSHLKKELQDKLFQFSYTLKKFSQKDQIDCLSKYWTNKLEMLDNVQKESIQSFGEKLVKGLSTTLKDKERDFIGIPLQCRMLAEIYETQLENTIRQGLSIDSLIQDISKTDLDLTSLYSFFMEKKFEIYVSQKLKTEINSTIKCTKNILDKYLRKLAIKTIVFYSDDVDVLLGKSKFVSRKVMREEEEHLTDAGVCCGFLDRKDKGKVNFLHRTFAEYLFAKYLHAGFLPEEDENYTELLTSQPVRETIYGTIFVDEQYEGVRMFFNSFLIKQKVEPTFHLSREIEKYYRIVGVAIRDAKFEHSSGLKNAKHGNIIFQLKLLMLFLIRGIGVGYQFQLGTEIPGMGGKFDDLIFKYEIEKADGTNAKTERYRFLQAKHKQNEETEKITAADLLKDNDGEFSLPKYFRSYFRDIIQGPKRCLAENVQDCIICTNIGFDNEDNLRKEGIELIPLDDRDDILSFDNKVSARYKLKKTDKLYRMMAGWSEVHLLAKTLLDYATQNQKLTLNCVIFKSYHLVLVKEKVIDRQQRPVTNEKKKRKKGEGSSTGKLNKDFLDGTLIGNVKEFRQILSDLTFEKMKNKETKDSAEVRESVFQEFWSKKSFKLSESFGTKDDQSPDETKKSLDCAIREEDITNFLDKLVFAVQTPNEVELNSILKGEVGKYYGLHEIDFQSDFILRNMLDWFKEKKSTFMTSEEGKKIFEDVEKKMESLRVTVISIDYQKKLKEALEFNDKAIGEMKKKLMQLLTLPNRIGRIATTLPKRTAVKVIGALEKFKLEEPNTNNELLKEYFESEDSYLVTKSSDLQNGPFKFESNNSHNLLVVVCEDPPSKEIDKFCEKLMVNKMQNKRVIIISQDKGEVEDELNFSDLSRNSQRVLLEKKIEFQGSLQSVEDLIKRSDTTVDGLIKNAEKILDSNSIKELIEEEQIKIPSGNFARFEENLYIERQLEFPLANFNQFYDQLAKQMKCEKEKLQNEFKVDSQGNIEWFVEEVRKKEIWKIMKKIVKENSISTRFSNDNLIKRDLITNENRKGKVFILDGIAGTGKSTILSNYYEKIKKENPNTWVIRIDLMDYPNELKKFKFSTVNQGNAIEFYVNLFAKKSPFARSLLTHRFKTDGRIVVMLDGFDEIGDELREKVFQFITAIKLTKVDALYLTTRSHLKKELQDELFQFSYPLKKFSEKDQVDCLSKYWTSKLEKQNNLQEESIQSFGETLVTRLSTTLKDKGDFIGIPLHCRMLAEIYETQLIDTIRQGSSMDSLIQEISTTDLDLTSLYSFFMEKKFEIYVSQKLKTELNSNIEYTKNNLEKYLTKLAIKTIVFYSDDVDVLLGKSKFVSRKVMREEEEHLTDAGVCCGFLDRKDKGKVNFLHRTYAEYLFAKYLHAGFLPEEDENYTELLTSQPVRELIFRTILLDEQYEGVRVFFNSFLIKQKVEPTFHLSREIEKCYRIVGVAIRDQNANLFTFLCDCLERFISYYDDENADEKAVEFILHEMFHMQLKNVCESQPNQEEITKIIERIIRFFDRNREMTKKMLNNSKTIHRDRDVFGDSGFIVNALLFNECYSSHLKPFLELLSSVYCEDTEFEDFLLETVTEYKHDISRGNLEKTLTILRDLDRNEVLNGISGLIFERDAQLFKSFYQPKKEASTKDVLLPTNIQSLLERDSYKMTRLHRAALHGDEETVRQILETIRICCSSPDMETQNMGMEVLDKVFAIEKDYKEDDEDWRQSCMTPLYVAAACEHENIFKQMLKFLRDVLFKGELPKDWFDKYGLFDALWDAMEREKVEMFRIILKCVKEILGQDYLINLMKENSFNRCIKKIKSNKKIFKVIVEVIVDGENYYTDLTDLFLKNMDIYQFQYIDSDTLQGMLKVNGMDAWIKRLLDTDLRKGFDLVLNHLLEKLNAEQRPQLLRLIISGNSGQESYFDRWLDKFLFDSSSFTEIVSSLMHFMKRVSDNLGQIEIKKLLTRNDNRIMKKAFFYCGKELVNKMLSYLSNEKDVISLQDLENIVSKFIEDAVTDKLKDETYSSGGFKVGLQNMLDFVFDYVEKFDLSKLVKTISYNYTDRDGDDMWSVYLKRNLEEKRIDKFLKCISDKLGSSAVEKLVVLVVKHENGEFIDLVLAQAGNEDLINVLLRHLSEEKRDEIEQKLVKEAPEKIKNLSTHRKIDDCMDYCFNILQYVVKHAGADELLRLIETITQSYDDNYFDEDNSRKTSIWRSYLLDKYPVDKDLRSQNVDKFLQRVSQKLGKSKVKELVMHKCDADGMTVLHYVKYYRRDTSLVEAMLTHLTEKDREEVWCEPAIEMSDEESDSSDEEIAID